MVDISRALTSANHISKFAPDARLPYIVEVKVTAEQMIAAKGSAIAASDVFDIVRFPAGTCLLNVWVKKTKAFAGSSTDLTLDIGFTGGDTDFYTDGWDFDAAAVDSFATPNANTTAVGTRGADGNANTGAANVVSILVASQTGTWTSGSLTFYCLAIDFSDSRPYSGIVALGS